MGNIVPTWVDPGPPDRPRAACGDTFTWCPVAPWPELAKGFACIVVSVIGGFVIVIVAILQVDRRFASREKTAHAGSDSLPRQ